MFKLTDQLVNTVVINGTTYDVDMSFDNVLRLIAMLNDEGLSDAEQIILGMQMLFTEPFKMPLDEQAEIFNRAYVALIGVGTEDEIEYDIAGNPMPKMMKEDSDGPAYDFEQDAEYIYASFMQDYGIDLFEHQGKMHWYKFKALLAGLSETTKFKKVLEIRQMELPSGPKSGKQRKAVEELKKAYALKGKAVAE